MGKHEQMAQHPAIVEFERAWAARVSVK